MQRPTARTLVKPLVFILCALPFAWLVVGVTTDDLGPNPVDTITQLTGEWGLRILLATLCITPLQKLSGYRGLLRFRRMLGLYAFFYVALHLFTYLLLDAEFDLAWIIEDIRDRLYITAGFSGFCLMVPLALTSTQGMIKRLGAKRWQRLHSLVYISALAGVLHFLWLVKADTREPLVYAGVFLVLMVLRLPKLTQRLAQKKKSTQLPASSAKAA